MVIKELVAVSHKFLDQHKFLDHRQWSGEAGGKVKERPTLGSTAPPAVLGVRAAVLGDD